MHEICKLNTVGKETLRRRLGRRHADSSVYPTSFSKTPQGYLQLHNSLGKLTG